MARVETLRTARKAGSEPFEIGVDVTGVRVTGRAVWLSSETEYHISSMDGVVNGEERYRLTSCISVDRDICYDMISLRTLSRVDRPKCGLQLHII